MLRYERNINHSYIVFEEEETTFDTLAVAMLRNNPIEGLLCPEISKNNTKTRFAYEISKYQTMLRLLEKTQMGSGQIITFLNTICVLSEELEGHLLETNHIVLNPEYVYWNEEAENVFFCYDPFTHFDFKNGLKELSTLILQKIDSEDMQALKAAYTLFRAVNETCFSLEDVLAKLRQEEPAYTFVQDKAIVADVQIPFGTTQDVYDEEKGNEHSKEEGTIIHPIQKGIARLFEEEEDDWEKEVSQGRLFGTSGKKKAKKGKLKKSRAKEYVDDESAGKAEYLSTERFILSSLNSGINSFEVETFPFLIGSIPYAVDACIDDESISRFHARLERSNGRVYLSDLNSSEGTFLNNKRLNGKIRQEIKVGDRIRLGNLEFSVG